MFCRAKKDYIEQMFTEHLKYGNSKTKWQFTLFSSYSTLYYLFFLFKLLLLTNKKV